MNGKEHDILSDIKNEIKDISKEIKETKEQVSTVKQAQAETNADVKNLVGWVTKIDEKLTNWDDKGCTAGRVIATKVENLEKECDEVRKDVKDAQMSKKQAAAWGTSTGAGAGAIISAIAHALFTIFK